MSHRMNAAAAPRSPDALLIVVTLLVLAIGLTWIVPAGEYQRRQDGPRTVVVPGSYHLVGSTPVP